MNPTTEQQAFIEWCVNGTGNGALQAFAGTGKSTTILLGVDAYRATHPQHNVAVFAFNKPIQLEMEHKLKARGHDWKDAQAMTVHSGGFGLCKFQFRLDRNAIDNKKVYKLIDKAREASPNRDVYYSFGGQISQLVKLAKQAGFGFFDDAQIGSVDAWYELADHFDVNGLDNTSQADQIVSAAQDVYRNSLAWTSVVDFDDMVLFPLVYNLRVKYTKDLVFVDEAQDLSRARQALIRKFVNTQHGRLVLVGDARQAIYGFSGADEAAMENLISQLNAHVMPLSVTWRCPRAVVESVQDIVPGYTSAPNAKEGEIVHTEKLPVEELNSTCAILCRNTAPLIDIAYSLIRAKVACKVEGRKIGEGLVKLATRWKVDTIAELLDKLDDYREREMQKAAAKSDEAKMDAVADKCQTLATICEVVLKDGKHNIADVVEFIESLFADGAKGVVTLATYHRSKGREWQSVYLYEPWRCPSKYARQGWQLRQEENLRYVAQTRCLNRLVFVG